MNRDPSSLAEAQKCVEAHEHNFKATVGRETEIKNRTRRISWVDEDFAAGEDFNAFSRRVQTPQYVTTDQITALKDEVQTLVKTIEHLQLQLGCLQSTRAEHQQAKLPVQTHVLAQHHVQPGRPRSRSPSPNRAAPGTCFLCGEQGHFRRDCTKSLSPTAAQNHGEKHPDHHVQSEETRHSNYQQQGLQLSCAKNKGESLQILVTVNGIPTEAVVDTGAQTTVISEELYQNFSGDPPTSLCKTYLLNAGVGDGMKAKRGLSVTFKIASKTIN